MAEWEGALPGREGPPKSFLHCRKKNNRVGVKGKLFFSRFLEKEVTDKQWEPLSTTECHAYNKASI